MDTQAMELNVIVPELSEEDLNLSLKPREKQHLPFRLPMFPRTFFS